MPTKLYLHSAVNDLSGTFPSGEQSARTPSWTTTGGATLRKMDTAIGAAQASLAGTTLAQTAAQIGLLGMWVSPPLSGAQTVGGGTMVLNAADQESNASANFWANSVNVYVWRPSTGAKVGTVLDATGSLGGTEGGTGETVTHITGIASSAVSASDGDVVVCELWGHHTQSMATAYTATVYFDGTTENTTENAAVSNHASFLELAETLTFQGGAISGTASITQADNTASATGTVNIAGTASISQADNTSTATGAVAIVGTASVTQAGDSLSSAAALDIVGTATLTQAGDTVSAAGTIADASISGAANITQDGNTLSATGAVGIAGTAAITQAGDTASATGTAAVLGAATVTQAGDALSAAGELGIAGTATLAQSGDTISAAGTGGGASISGTTDITQADNILSGAGFLLISGTSGLAQADNTLAATASLAITGSANISQADNTLVATGVLSITGIAFINQADNTLIATMTGAIDNAPGHASISSQGFVLSITSAAANVSLNDSGASATIS